LKADADGSSWTAAEINPLSPPCIPPNPGFRDLPAKSKFLAVEAFEVVGQANQRPFAADLLFAAQTEPTKASDQQG